MNQVSRWLKNLRVRQIFTVFLAAIAFLVIPAFSYGKAVQANADPVKVETDSYVVDDSTVKRIQQKAEDLGDRSERAIGDTGLKNIKKLGENIPETLDLNRRQGFFSGDPDNLDKEDAFDKAGNKVKGAVEGAKQAAKDAAS